MDTDEKSAISHWIAFGFCINNYIRNHDFFELLPSMVQHQIHDIIQSLDKIISKSVITFDQFQMIVSFQKDPNPQLFRAIWGSYAKEITDKLDKKFSSIDPDPGFESWTANINIAKTKFINEKSRHNVIFITDCNVNEKALFLGTDAYEILFPRHTAWRIISHNVFEEDGRTITFIYVKKRTIHNRG